MLRCQPLCHYSQCAFIAHGMSEQTVVPKQEFGFQLELGQDEWVTPQSIGPGFLSFGCVVEMVLTSVLKLLHYSGRFPVCTPWVAAELLQRWFSFFPKQLWLGSSIHATMNPSHEMVCAWCPRILAVGVLFSCKASIPVATARPCYPSSLAVGVLC